jgi:hypothetical protein
MTAASPSSRTNTECTNDTAIPNWLLVAPPLFARAIASTTTASAAPGAEADGRDGHDHEGTGVWPTYWGMQEWL